MADNKKRILEATLSPQTEIILNSIAEGVFTVDLEWRITFFNRANICESTCAL